MMTKIKPEYQTIKNKMTTRYSNVKLLDIWVIKVNEANEVWAFDVECKTFGVEDADDEALLIMSDWRS